MVRVSFRIPGRVRGKGRPRFSRATGHAHTDVKTRSDEAMVRHFAAMAMRGKLPLLGPLSLTVLTIMTPPESWSKKRRASTLYVTGKPDADNVIKALGDACNGIVFSDDSQIAEVTFSRRYSLTEQEHVDVWVETLDATEQQRAAA